MGKTIWDSQCGMCEVAVAFFGTEGPMSDRRSASHPDKVICRGRFAPKKRGDIKRVDGMLRFIL